VNWDNLERPLARKSKDSFYLHFGITTGWGWNRLESFPLTAVAFGDEGREDTFFLQNNSLHSLHFDDRPGRRKTKSSDTFHTW
jgi:hypothetical protein